MERSAPLRGIEGHGVPLRVDEGCAGWGLVRGIEGVRADGSAGGGWTAAVRVCGLGAGLRR